MYLVRTILVISLFTILLLSISVGSADALKSEGNYNSRVGVDICGDKLCEPGEELTVKEKLGYYLLSLVEMDDSTVIQQSRFLVMGVGGGAFQQSIGLSPSADIRLSDIRQSSSKVDIGRANAFAIPIDELPMKLKTPSDLPKKFEKPPSTPQFNIAPTIGTGPSPERLASNVDRNVLAKIGTLDKNKFVRMLDNSNILPGPVSSFIFDIDPEPESTQESEESEPELVFDCETTFEDVMEHYPALDAKTFDAGVTRYWQVAVNWDPEGFPTSTDNIIIDLPLEHGVDIYSFESHETMIVNSGKVALYTNRATLTNHGTFIISPDGELFVGAGAPSRDFVNYGTVINFGTVELANNEVLGAQINGKFYNQDGGILINYGTIDTPGIIQFWSGFTNMEGGLVENYVSPDLHYLFDENNENNGILNNYCD